MRSLIPKPFLFTSDKEFSDTSGKWYVMWINPQSLTIAFMSNEKVSYRKGGYGVLHWKNRLPTIKFSGVSGWVLRPDDFFSPGTNPNSAKQWWTKLTSTPTFRELSDPDLANAFQVNGQTSLRQALADLNKVGETPSTVQFNDARVFVNRLRRVALQEKYYYDVESGLFVYNSRRLVIFTKRYPEGKEIEGFFTDFNIPEAAEDAQMIRYSASFTVTSGLEEKGDEEEKGLLELLGVSETTRGAIDFFTG